MNNQIKTIINHFKNNKLIKIINYKMLKNVNVLIPNIITIA